MPFLFLILLQFIWASSYGVQKLALGEMPLGLVLIFRYGLATLILLLTGQLRFKNRFTPREWGLILFAGIINFAGSPFLQLKSLTLTYAVDVSILVSFEPLLTALVALLFLSEKLKKSTLLTFCVATAGMMVMSWQSGAASFDWVRLIGDGLFLLALLCEAACSGICKHLTEKENNRPLNIIGWMMLVGFLINLITNGPLLTLEKFKAIQPTGWIIILYLAILCSCIGYGGWVYLMKKIPLNQLALTLFLQPLFGTTIAVLLLDEPLNRQTILGGGIVLSTLLIWVAAHFRKKRLAKITP